ncbi:AzlC family ABC transporter permease [Abyssisolibacter fermentans]|uniref:AzlC family ABC transporter permease n=1 Tax=Abyssisolibacter fermentans TaxID=1766203 RepID=UPI0008357CBA|nr:AzlC family ABC transporter permease [Abyssisolibacter fermentans]
MKCSFKDGVIDSIPIVIGFVPIAMTFGILAKNADITMFHCILFSVLVFAGASQFIALNLILLGAGIGEIVLTTFLVNFRHFLMSASLTTKITKDMKKWSPFIAFGITDEVFSVASFKKGTLTKQYIISLELLAYSAWVSGTVLGYLVGGILPKIIKASMGIALYAMFVAILIPEAKKSIKPIILAGLSGIINSICIYFLTLPQGWSIVISIVLTSFIGLFLFKEEEEAVYE